MHKIQCKAIAEKIEQAQEKKMDHLEHAKRKKEIPLIVENMKQVLNLI